MSDPGAPAPSDADGSEQSRADAPWPVGILSAKLKDYIDRLGMVWVEGEITQWGTSGGNVYGKLKDLRQDATVSFRVWSSTLTKLKEEFRQGDRVIALVKAEFWPKGGTLTMQVFELRHVGLGDLLERLELLRRTLAAEGLFAPERKVRVPFLPRVVGLVTARDSDAEKDVRRNAELRWPSVRIRAAYAAVQGDRAALEVLGAIRRLDGDPEVDVIIVARGGGDFQHLLAFSDEALVRGVAEIATPIVSAIGHENDRPLLDEVADLRASTPTDAAKRVIPDVADELGKVRFARGRIATRVSDLVRTEIDRIAALRSRPVLATPERMLEQRADELTRYVARGTELATRTVEHEQRRVDELRARLRALSPQATLDRGYAVVSGPRGVVRDPADAASGDALRIRVAGGELGATAD